MSSLRGNIISGYISQLVSTLIWVIVVPIYVLKMGPEAYALVGFFSIAQLCFNFLDFGLTPTVARESARYITRSITYDDFMSKYRAIVLFFLIVATVCFALLFFLAPFASRGWFKVQSLSRGEVVLSLRLMAASVVLRWLTGISRGLLTGFEKIQWLNYFNLSMAILRFIGVLPVIYFINNNPSSFFYYQFFLALAELVFIYFKARSLIVSNSTEAAPIAWSLKPLMLILPFTLVIALTSAIWVFVTQLDKVLVSGLVSLEEYGYFVMATTVAAGVSLLVTPVTSSIMPRMTTLHELGKQNELLTIYRDYTQLASIFLSSSVMTLVFCEKYFLLGWTGSSLISVKIRDVMILYVLGNAFFAMGYFPYFIQYAKGSLRMHLIGYSILFISIMSSIYLGTSHFGLKGAGVAWLACNALYFFIWIAYTHAQVISGTHWSWLWKDILSIWLPVLLAGFLFSLLPSFEFTRVGNILYVMGFGVILLLVATLSSGVWRPKLKNNFLLLMKRFGV